ncbi:hypothetical protein WA577_007613, partial [Blastocystis sp. JDR]
QFVFSECSHVVLENLPELTSIQLGKGAFEFKNINSASKLVMKSLPKLTTITSSDAEHSRSFLNAKSITLQGSRYCHTQNIDMPSLSTITVNWKHFLYDSSVRVH